MVARLLLVIFVTTIPIARAVPKFETPDSELIYVVAPPTNDLDTPVPEVKQKKIRKYFLKQQKLLLDEALDASGNAISFPWVSLGFKLNVGSIDNNVLFRDADKLNNNQVTPLIYKPSTKPELLPHQKKWYHYRITATPSLGSGQLLNLFKDIDFPKIATPVVGAQGTSKVEYEMILPTNINNFEDKKLSGEMLQQLKGMVGTVFKFKIPLKAEAFLNQSKYPNGSEYSWKKKDIALFTLGADAPTQFVTAGVRLYILIDGSLKKKLRVYREGPKTFVQLDVISEKQTSDEKSVEVNLGVSLFQTGAFGASLKIRTLSSSTIKVKNKSFKMSYVFDLSYPESVKALNEALKSNYTHAQNLANSIAGGNDNINNYHGVLLLENVDQNFLKKVLAFNAGLFSSRFKIKLGPLSLALNKLIPDLIHYSSNKETTLGQGSYQYPFIKPITRSSLNIKQNKSFNLLWSLVANRGKELAYNNEVITYETQGGKKSINQITFLETVYNEKKNEARYNKYFTPSRYIFQLLKPDLSSLLYSVEQKNECYIDYKINKHIILYPQAIKRLTTISYLDFYKTFAKIFNSNFETWWFNEKTRNTTLEKHFNTLSNDPNMDPDLLNYLKKMYSLYKKLDKNDLPAKLKKDKSKTLKTLQDLNPTLEKLNETELSKEDLKTAISFHDTYSKYTTEPGFIDFISILSEVTGSGDYFIGFILKSEKCDIQWISSPQLTIDPEIISQEIDSYLQNE